MQVGLQISLKWSDGSLTIQKLCPRACRASWKKIQEENTTLTMALLRRTATSIALAVTINWAGGLSGAWRAIIPYTTVPRPPSLVTVVRLPAAARQSPPRAVLSPRRRRHVCRHFSRRHLSSAAGNPPDEIHRRYMQMARPGRRTVPLTDGHPYRYTPRRPPPVRKELLGGWVVKAPVTRKTNERGRVIACARTSKRYFEDFGLTFWSR